MIDKSDDLKKGFTKNGKQINTETETTLQEPPLEPTQEEKKP